MKTFFWRSSRKLRNYSHKKWPKSFSENFGKIRAKSFAPPKFAWSDPYPPHVRHNQRTLWITMDETVEVYTHNLPLILLGRWPLIAFRFRCTCQNLMFSFQLIYLRFVRSLEPSYAHPSYLYRPPQYWTVRSPQQFCRAGVPNRGYEIEHQGVRRSLGHRAAYISLI